MKKKLVYSFLVIGMLFVIINVFSLNIVYGANTVDGVMSGADDFVNQGNKQGSSINESALKETSNLVFNALLAFAMVLAVIVGIILGIRFMTESVEEKAKIKENLVVYLVGCIVVFGAFGIWKLTISVLSNW